MPVKLNIKAVTAEGVQIEAASLDEKLWIGTSYKLVKKQNSSEATNMFSHVEANAYKLSSLLRLLSEQMGVNISASQKAGEIPVSVFLRNVPVNVVVEELCRAHNLWYRTDDKNGIVRITTMPEYEGTLQTFRD